MDGDGDGKIGKAEFVKELLHVRQEERAHTHRARLLAVAVVIIALLACSNLLTTSVALALAKETKVGQGAQLATADGGSDSPIVQTAKASATFPLSAAPAMTIARLADVNSLTVTLYLYGGIATPPFLEPGMRGKVQKVSEVVSATKLSPTAVLFSLAEQGQTVLIADGGANMTVRDTNGAVLWRNKVCPDDLGCAAITLDSEAEGAALVAMAQEELASSRRRLGCQGSCTDVEDDWWKYLDNGCVDPATDDAESLDCECLEQILRPATEGGCGYPADETCVLEHWCDPLIDASGRICSPWKNEHCQEVWAKWVTVGQITTAPVTVADTGNCALRRADNTYYPNLWHVVENGNTPPGNLVSQVCPQGKSNAAQYSGRQLSESSELEDAFEGIDTFVKGYATHGRRLGKCSQ